MINNLIFSTMFKRTLIIIIFVLTGIVFFVGRSAAQNLKAESSGEEEQGDLFVHPFFAHMSLADPVGEASFRFTGMQRRDESGTFADFGLHIEAGLLPRLGIHIRSDALNMNRMIMKAMKKSVVTGKEEMMHEIVDVLDPVKPYRHVRFQNEIWNASSGETLRKGDKAEIAGLNGLTLIVKKIYSK
jgi:hypothetical protein